MDIKELYKLYQQHPCITTDSRNCPEGSIFLALKGASFNGNQFAKAALEQGCAYAIIDEAEILEKQDCPDSRIILVDDCLQTYKIWLANTAASSTSPSLALREPMVRRQPRN